MNVSLICYLEYGVKENSSVLVATFSLGLLGEDSHLVISLLECLELADSLLLHFLQFLLFPPDGSLDIDLAALLVSGIAKLPVVNDDVLALFGAPFLIVKLLFLLGLALHALQDLV